MVDLRHIFGVSINKMVNVQVAVAFGYVLGSLIGWTYRWLNRQLLIIAFGFLKAVTISLVPYYGTFWSAMFALFLFGVGIGAWDASASYWLIEIWPVRNPMVLQFQQFMFGLGAIGAPLLAAPYVRGEAATDDSDYPLSGNITVPERIGLLTVPFAINGGIHCVAPTLLLFLYCTYPYQGPASPASAKGVALEPVSKMTTLYQAVPLIPNRKGKLILCGICMAFYLSTELAWFQFSATLYQYLEIALDARSAARTLAILLGTYTFGRLVTAFLTLYLLPDTIILYHYLLIAAGLVTLYNGRASLTVIYGGSALLGYGYSAMLPCIFAFTNRHLALSARVNSCLAFSAGLLSSVTPLILGQTFAQYPLTLFLIEGTFLAVSALAFTSVRLWIALDAT